MVYGKSAPGENGLSALLALRLTSVSTVHHFSVEIRYSPPWMEKSFNQTS